MNSNEMNGSLFLVPKMYLERILSNQEKIIQLLEKRGGDNFADYISEAEAKKIIGRRTTWFWKMRTKGHLAFSKVGKKIFYFRKDLEKLLERNRSEAFLEGRIKG